VGGTEESDTRGAVGSFHGGCIRAHVALNSAHDSQSGNFAAQDGAKARARQKISAPRHFPAPAGGARGLSRAANRRLICHAGVLERLLEML
jgi:hypothetical protein